MKKSFAGLLAFWLLAASPAVALENNFPAMMFYPEPVGIVYPGLSSAGGINPAALMISGSGTALQAGFSPGYNGDENQFFGSFANSPGKFGFGIGWKGHQTAPGTDHSGFIGIGSQIGKMRVGAALRDYNMNSGFSPSLDVSIMTEVKAVDLAFVFYDLQGMSRLGLGVGTRTGSRFNLEANLILPPFSDMTLGYLITASCQISVMPLGVYFRTSYNTWTRAFSHTLGGAYWITKQVNFAIQYSIPNRASGAVTVSL